MKKILIVLLLSASVLSAKETGLFGKIIHVAEDDTLNVRAEPNYKARKIAEIPSSGYVGVEKCRQVKTSLWCQVYPLTQQWYEHFSGMKEKGWVNAKYLSFSDRGYVLVDGKANCDYVIQCKADKCERVFDYETDDANEIKNLKTEWIDKKRLHGESRFGASSSDPKINPEGDICSSAFYIDDYLQNRRLKQLSAKTESESYQTLLKFLKIFSRLEPKTIAAFVHPTAGLTLSYYTVFGRGDKHFTAEQIRQIDVLSEHKHFWGYTDGKGDAVYMTLYDFLAFLPHNTEPIREIQPLKVLHGFHCAKNAECQGYEVLWYDKPREEDFSWQGLVVILELYRGKWYVTGLLRDRWTI
ncbi:SH3 domain-containing protein [Sulfurovum sp.]|uniref:SH3 domain-containing protein n=1 Tax=Sulfurovum sp. TaxID=1969726 RepID=UPI0025ECFCE8|nr:SH3 domain-containing protein [Sulfurovum sp.]